MSQIKSQLAQKYWCYIYVMRCICITGLVITVLVGYGRGACRQPVLTQPVLQLCANASGGTSATLAPASLGATSRGSELSLKANLPLQVKDAASLANALSNITKKRTLVVMPDEASFKAQLKAVSRNGVVQWGQLQAVLAQIGAMTFRISGSATVGIVQGRSYAGTKESVQECAYAQSQWGLLVKALQELNAPSRTALLSSKGLIFPSDFAGCPPSLKAIATSDIIGNPIRDTPNKSAFRVHITLGPGVDMAFPQAPPGFVKAWWYWSYDLPGGSLKFPMQLAFPLKSAQQQNQLLNLGTGAVSQQRFGDELKHVTGYAVKVNPHAQWPTVAVAGGSLPLAELLQCLRASSSIEVRPFQREKLFYVTISATAEYIVGARWMTADQYHLFQDILTTTSHAWEIDLGPLVSSDVSIPLQALPSQWIRPILGSPSNADDVEPGRSYMNLPEQERVDKWLKAYAASDTIFVPYLSLTVQYEQNLEKFNWVGVASGEQAYSPICG